MKFLELPPLDVLNEFFSYDPESGKLTWKKLYGNTRNKQIGDTAGTIALGYYRVKLKGVVYAGHRICYAIYHNLQLPPEVLIDHINRNRSDNRICNLRIVSHGENIKNSPLRKDNKTGHKGIHFLPSGSYGVTVGKKYIGSSTLLEEAIEMREAALATM